MTYRDTAGSAAPRRWWSIMRMAHGSDRHLGAMRKTGVTVLLSIAALSFLVVQPWATPTTVAATTLRGCSADMVWPIDQAVVVRGFDLPEEPWLPGHRGVDIAVDSGAAIHAPDDGTIRFVGMVGGKNVVSVSHGSLVSTFEPATTTLAPGDAVRRGEPFAQVEGVSEHCDGQCLHWGIRYGEQSYRDPMGMVSRRTIRLKPLAHAP